MNKNIEAPINFYGINSDSNTRTNFELPVPKINFAEDIQIRLPKE